MLLGIIIGLFIGALIGFFAAALLAMSGTVSRDQEIAALKHQANTTSFGRVIENMIEGQPK